MPAVSVSSVASLRQLITWLTGEIGLLAAELLSGHEGYQAARALPGIGKVLGAVVVAEIGDITRFRHPARLCSGRILVAAVSESRRSGQCVPAMCSARYSASFPTPDSRPDLIVCIQCRPRK